MSAASEQPNGAHTRSDTVTSDTTMLAGQTPRPSAIKTTTSSSGSTSTHAIIPPEHPFRTLILCFDGTGDQFDADNSNIVELFSMLKKDDPSKQMVYYQAGIGTYTIPQIATPVMSKISKTIDEMIAWNLSAHIMGGYEFLMQNYKAGDRICIFGFSRGAYTARCLAGMIHKVGLLPACNHQQVPFAYKMYTQPDERGWRQSNAFRKAFSIDVDIEFLGVWDTVNSVGLIPKRLPFTTSNTIVCTFRHAVSLDEHRAKFKANLWNRPEPTEELLSTTDQKIEKHAKAHSHHQNGSAKKLTFLEREYSKDRSAPTDIDEVWFAGCHCDIGGGSVTNGVKPCLSRIPLRWMIRECFKTKSGIMFDVEGLKAIGLDPDSLYHEPLPRPPALPIGSAKIQGIPKQITSAEPETSALAEDPAMTEEEHELQDALAPIYDQLSLAWYWWILEFIPLRHRYQKSNNTWAHWWGINFGEGRRIKGQDKDGVRVHRSVKQRMEAGYANGKKYKPKANLNLDHVTWVD